MRAASIIFCSAALCLILTNCGQNTQNGTSNSAATDTQLLQLAPPYNTANYANGRRVFAQCTACHNLGNASRHRVGPNLGGIFTRTAGSAQGFTYSQALMDADFVWTPDQLEEWLYDPEGFLPGNRMQFLGVARAQDRTDLIAYLLVETAAD